MPVLTITHQRGALGEEIARRLSLKLGIPIIHRDEAMEQFLSDVVSPNDLLLLSESPRHFLKEAKDGVSFRDLLTSRLAAYADKQNAVMLGFSAHLLLANHPHAIHLNVTAPFDVRVERFRIRKGQNAEQVREKLLSSDRKSRRYATILYGAEEQDPFLYHLTVNTGKVSVDAAVSMAAGVYKDQMAREFLFNSEDEDLRVRKREEESTRMKNVSEISFARVLDMYQLRWIYEPKTFPLEWDSDGNVTLGFSPDFYLPDYNLYLELTVMNPKYASNKHKKARLLGELYPGTNVQVVYRRDFDHLLRSLSTAGESISEAYDEAQSKGNNRSVPEEEEE
ncbi:MAG: cytidylate kinase-like family protein [Clostridiaceae bacterium]|nr:cytidylate kinase-like family protein [Clostridiaceae bacterium]